MTPLPISPLLGTLLALMPVALLASEAPYLPGSAGPAEQAAFARLAAREWRPVFRDAGSGDWRDKWTLDGKHASITNTPAGMEFRAGPKVDPAHHAVLWTRQSFTGDVKIEYEYTRLDEAKEFVTILYIQATGDGKDGRAKDIATWADQRTRPDMWRYYKGMHLYHISMAAFDAERGTPEYIRARRYMAGSRKKEHKWPHGTALEPDYLDSGLWQTGEPHRITVIKQDRDLWMEVTSGDQRLLCHWHNDRLPPILAGRIGLRHMHTRQARYRDFTVSVPVSSASSAADPATTAEAATPLPSTDIHSQLIEDADAPTDVARPITDRGAWPVYYKLLNLQRGMYHQGSTYVCFHGDGEDHYDPYVMVYRHATATVEGPFKAGDTALPPTDTHGNPGLIVDDQGYIHVIYGGHGNSGKMLHARSRHPEDISSWQQLDTIPSNATYPKLLKMSDGTIYYTHRDGTHGFGHVLWRSTDHGMSFGERQAVLGGAHKNGGKRRNDGVYAQQPYRDAWYTHIRKGTGDSFHMMFFYHACSVPTPQHADHNEHGERRLNLYYIKYEHATRSWHTVAGTDITKHLPLDLKSANKHCLVYESQVKAQPGQVDNVGFVGLGVTPADTPILSYVSSGDYPLRKDFTVSRLAIAENGSWRHLATAQDPNPLIAGIPDDIESTQAFSLYSGSGIIRTTDGGTTWKRLRHFRSSDTDEGGVTFFESIFQAHPDARYLSAEPRRKGEQHGVELHLWGDGGFLQPAP